MTRLEEEISEANTAMSELKKSQTASSVDGRIDALKIELQEKVTSLKTADQNIIDLKAKITILEESSLLSNKLAEDMKEVEKQLEKQVEYAALLCKKVDDYKRLAEEQKPMAITSQTDGAGATKSTKEADSRQKQVENSKVKSDKVKDDVSSSQEQSNSEKLFVISSPSCSVEQLASTEHSLTLCLCIGKRSTSHQAGLE